MKEDNPFQNSEFTTILVVSDMLASKSFYTDILGADLHREYGGTSIVLKFLNNWILLVKPGPPTKDKPTVSFNPPTRSYEVSHAFTIRVDNCKKSYDTLKERGAKFLTPPCDWGKEMRCFFKDPDGHLFEISEIKTSK